MLTKTFHCRVRHIGIESLSKRVEGRRLGPRDPFAISATLIVFVHFFTMNMLHFKCERVNFHNEMPHFKCKVVSEKTYL